jgi:CheY-like chemotaxis protein
MSDTAAPVVLVVEDYEPNLMVAGILLRQMNLDMDSATNGYAAIEKIKGGRQYAAIMMDLQMAGMNGVNTTRHIREYEAANRLPKTPIIGVTAHMLPGTEEACRSAGMNDFMTKPYTPEELHARIGKLIGV